MDCNVVVQNLETISLGMSTTCSLFVFVFLYIGDVVSMALCSN